MTNPTDLLKAFNIIYATLEDICNKAPTDSPLEQQAGTALYKASKILLSSPKEKTPLKLVVQVSPKINLIKTGLDQIETTKILSDRKNKLHLVV